MKLTAEQFAKCFPSNPSPAEWADALNPVLLRHSITTPLRVCAFLAQCGHESNGFTDIAENLNYSAAALLATWPKRFSKADAEKWARNREMIGNIAYANRMGNGPPESGDGYRYRGRGIIQLTGKATYQDFAKYAEKSLVDVIPFLETKEGAAESAGWYWASRNLNPLADKGDMLALTKRINGGTNGLEDRLKRYERMKRILL